MYPSISDDYSRDSRSELLAFEWMRCGYIDQQNAPTLHTERESAHWYRELASYSRYLEAILALPGIEAHS